MNDNLIIIAIAGLVLILIAFLLRTHSRRRFAWNLLRQLPYIIPRYFV